MSKTATTHVKTRIQSGRSIRNYDRGITKHYDHHSSYPDTCDGLSFNVLQRYRKTTTALTQIRWTSKGTQNTKIIEFKDRPKP